MPKESGRNRNESRDEVRRHRRERRRCRYSRGPNAANSSNAIQNCQVVLEGISISLDILNNMSNLFGGELGQASSSKSQQSINFEHSLGHNCDNNLNDPQSHNIERWINILESKCKYRDPSITSQAIRNIMSKSSTCQLQLLEFSLQCPLSHAKIKLPVKSRLCQHIGCFDARSFLSVMITKSDKFWKCPLCSVQATFDTLITDGFIQNILKQTPDDVKIIEFTSDLNWTVKKDATLVNNKKQLKPDVECIDLTFSPMPAKKTTPFFVDLTKSP